MTTKQNYAINNMAQSLALMLIFSIFSMFQSCTETIDTGAELFDQEIRNTKVDSLPCGAINVSEDVVEAYNINAQSTVYPLGVIDDPAFGRLTSSINLQLLPQFRPDTATFKNTTLVDVKMYARFATSKIAFPGSYEKDQCIEVYELADSLWRGQVYKSNTNFAAPKLLGKTSFNLTTDKLWVNTFDPNMPEPLAITLDKSFGERLLKISSKEYALDTIFQGKMRGLCLKPAAQNTSMLYMDLVDKVSVFADNFRTRVELRFKKGSDTTIYTLKFFAFNTKTSACAKVNKYDYTPSPNIGIDSLSSKNYLYLHAPIGPNVKVKLPNLSAYKGKLITKAEIEFTVALNKVGNSFLRHIPTQLLLDTNNDGIENYINDVYYGSAFNYRGFGGQPIFSFDSKGNKVIKYRFNISDYVQRIAKGTATQKDLFLAYYFKSEIAGQVVFYGTDHPTYAPQVKIVYSDL